MLVHRSCLEGRNGGEPVHRARPKRSNRLLSGHRKGRV